MHGVANSVLVTVTVIYKHPTDTMLSTRGSKSPQEQATYLSRDFEGAPQHQFVHTVQALRHA